MKTVYKAVVAIILIMFLSQVDVYAQGKYIGVYYKAPKKFKANEAFVLAETFAFGYVGLVANPQTTKTHAIKLEYPGKTRKQLHDAVLKYINSSTSFVLENDDNLSVMSYRNFAMIGNKSKCQVDLYALTVWRVGEFDGEIYIAWKRNDIYASISGAQLQVTKFDEVVAVDDLPFNLYSFIQPSEIMRENQSRPIWEQKKTPLKLAYPDSVFDPDGKVVNPTNKKMIEDFYDSYITSIKNYLDKNL